MKLVTGFVLMFLASLASAAEFKVRVVQNVEQFRKVNPWVKLVEMDAQYFHVDDTKSYSSGSRQTGDVVVANVSKKLNWPTVQNVTTTITYPVSGRNGAFLTYILINCEQGSNLGRAYFTAGGIGQHFVEVIVEAQNTKYFNYAAFFYGIK